MCAPPDRPDVDVGPDPRDRTLLLAAIASPTGVATRIDALALVKNTLAWIAVVGGITAVMYLVWRADRASRRILRAAAEPDRCASCAYDLTDLPAALPCPECGRARHTHAQPRTHHA